MLFARTGNLQVTITQDENGLRLVGRALFGMEWQNELARSLGVNERTVQRWAKGEQPITPWVWPRLAQVCEYRGGKLLRLSQGLRELVGDSADQQQRSESA